MALTYCETIGAAGANVPDTGAARDVITYLQAMHITASMGIIDRGKIAGPYTCMADFVLRHGEWFEPPVHNPHDLGLPRHCFYNAQEKAGMEPETYTYVEGYGHPNLMPVHHGWCVHRDGMAVDNTWDWSGLPEQGCALFGVRIPVAIWHRYTLITGHHSILDDWGHGWPILRLPYQPDSTEYHRALFKVLIDERQRRAARRGLEEVDG